MTVMKQVCKNCGNHFSGLYCNHCGQKVAHRLDTRHILHETVHVFTHADKGIFALIPAILFRPGLTALDYVQGKRKRYFSIFQYLVIIVGIATFIVAKTHWIEEAGPVVGGRGATTSEAAAVQKEVVDLVRHYFNLFLFVLIPVFAFFSWLLFRSKGYNYAENFVLQMAIQAQLHTYAVLIIFPLLIMSAGRWPGLIVPLAFILLLGCHTIANRQFFKVPILQAFVKGFLVYLFANVFQILLIALAIMVVLIRRKG